MQLGKPINLIVQQIFNGQNIKINLNLLCENDINN